MSLHNQELKTMHVQGEGEPILLFLFGKTLGSIVWSLPLINIPSFSFYKVNEVRKKMQKKKKEEGGEFLKIGRTQCEDSVVLMGREGSVAREERVWLAANSSSYGGCASVWTPLKRMLLSGVEKVKVRACVFC